MSLGCHNHPFMSRQFWFSCSTGLEPDPGGGAEWEEALNQFTATGLRMNKGRHTGYENNEEMVYSEGKRNVSLEM